jgi:hypothetical protein
MSSPTQARLIEKNVVSGSFFRDRIPAAMASFQSHVGGAKGHITTSYDSHMLEFVLLDNASRW